MFGKIQRQCSVSVIVVGLLLAGCSQPVASPPTVTASPDGRDVLLPVAVGLARDSEGLQEWLKDSADRSSPNFLSRMTADEIVMLFGASAETVSTATQALASHGFVGSLDPSGSILVGTIPLKDAQKLFKVRIIKKDLDGRTIAYPSKTPTIPADLEGVVTDVAGLGRTISTTAAEVSSDPTVDLASVKCPGLMTATKRLASISGIDEMRAKGNDGVGVSLALLGVVAVSETSLDAARSCAGLAIPPVSTVTVATTQASDLSGIATEPTLDILAATAMAPGLEEIRAYQFDRYGSMVFPLAAVVADSLNAKGFSPDLLSSSIGVCQTTMSSAEMSISEWLLAVGAAGGLTTVASTGDTGSSGCAPQQTYQSALYPAASEYATALGGTKLVDRDGQEQVVWRDSGTAGGGSWAASVPRPWYQAAGVSGPPNRIVPDISSVAAPSQFPAFPVCDSSGCQLVQVGGTSAGAPAVAGGLAVVLQSLRSTFGEDTMRLGLVNPMLYSLALSKKSPKVFVDITEGNNDLYSVGCCSAAPGFDAASGWGSVNFGELHDSYRSRIESRVGD